MERTSSFVSMPENEQSHAVFRKPAAFGNTVTKSAFSDLSNRVPRGAFRPGTPRKAAFAGKPLMFQASQENYPYTQLSQNKATEGPENRISLPPKNDRESAVKSFTIFTEECETVQDTNVMNSNKEENDLPVPESFHPIQQHDLDYYASLPSPPMVHDSHDFEEEDFDFGHELRCIYKEPELVLRHTPVEEKEMSMFAESVYSGVYLDV